MNLGQIFQLLTDIFEKTGVRPLLVGGFALGAYGVQRTTEDVDFMFLESDYEKLKPALLASGFKEIYRSHLFARVGDHPDLNVDVDFLFVDETSFQGIQSEGKELKLEGKSLRVPSLKHLIALKLHAMREDPKRRMVQDLPDVVRLAQENSLDVRSDDFKKLCLTYGSEALYSKILGLADAK